MLVWSEKGLMKSLKTPCSARGAIDSVAGEIGGGEFDHGDRWDCGRVWVFEFEGG